MGTEQSQGWSWSAAKPEHNVSTEKPDKVFLDKPFTFIAVPLQCVMPML